MKDLFLDAITVQSSGLRQLPDGTYASTLYSEADEYGMLGGSMRLRAVEELYWHNPETTFVFCNGTSAKQIAKFGPNVPIEADVHVAEFKRDIARDARSLSEDVTEPKILLENTSVNTAGSLRELIAMAVKHGWKRMAVVSSDYHIPRITGICELIFQKMGERPVKVVFLSAEAILKELRPGVYDAEIDAAYKTPVALQRIENERKGCADISARRVSFRGVSVGGEVAG